MRPLAAFALATVAVAAWTSSCGGGGEAPSADAGSDGAVLDTQAPCPTAAPPSGSSCAAPEGTTCAFGACGGYAVCTLGQWRLSPTIPGAICPGVEPAAGEACPPCFPSGKTCVYVSTTCADPTPTGRTLRASCGTTGWVLEIGACPPATPTGDGGVIDSGNNSGTDGGDATPD